MGTFTLSHIVTVLGLVGAYFWAGLDGFILASLLIIMEVSLSFDNAVVNATVLRRMDPIWQKRFLTWGILIAVFGMRLVFPVLVVAIATGLGAVEVTRMAFTQPAEYSRHVLAAHVDIASFGGIFLLMVFLHFICNSTKDTHWIGPLERRLAALGKLESVEIVIALGVLLLLQPLLPDEARIHSLVAGVIGLVSYVLVKSVTALFAEEGEEAAKIVSYSGFMGFMYLQLLDASFSLDGVIGAFAISNDVVLIMLGLGVGAMFVRSLTVYLVRRGTLDAYVYLEHGAHYGIGALAVIMLVSMVVHVPEVVTGLVGVTFILLSLFFLGAPPQKGEGLMELAQGLIVAILGLCCGSFITLASYRLPRGLEIIFTPSRCASCNRSLRVRDLVPVFSWVLSCAQCGFCKHSIHWRYPAVELVTAAVFLLIHARFGVTWEAVILALFATALLIMIVADFEHYIIPDEVHYALLPLGFVYRIFNHVPLMEVAGGLALGLGIGLSLRFGYQWVKKREGLGWGDVKFLAVVGLWLGATAMVPFLFFAGVLGICTALLWRILGKGALFPFGPALALSLFFCVVYPEIPELFWNLQRAFYE